MTATKPGWRVALRRGDTLKLSTTYDTRRASWYESMGIDVVYYADGIQPGAVDPFAGRVDWHGELTHGHLPENDHHGGTAARRSRRPRPGRRPVRAQGEHRRLLLRPRRLRRHRHGPPARRSSAPASRSRSPTSTPRAPSPAQRSAYHTITACRAPCTATTGVAYPLANGPVRFDSGELGYGGPPSADRNTWATPKSLRPGTYTYFCRIHPFMRGSFRVVR